jgi:hypothetical protein
VELYLRDSGLTFSWPCSRLRGALGEEISANPGAPAPCSPDQLATIARLLEDQEIPEAKIWLSAGLSAFLFLYTSILGLVASPFGPNQSIFQCADTRQNYYFHACGWLCSCADAGLARQW